METNKERVEKAFENAKRATELITLLGTDLIVSDIVFFAWAMIPRKHKMPGIIIRGVTSGIISYGIYDALVEKQVDDVFDTLKERTIAKIEEREREREAEAKEVV